MILSFVQVFIDLTAFIESDFTEHHLLGLNAQTYETFDNWLVNRYWFKYGYHLTIILLIVVLFPWLQCHMRQLHNYEYEMNFKGSFIYFVILFFTECKWFFQKHYREQNVQWYRHYHEINDILTKIDSRGLFICSSILFFKNTADVLQGLSKLENLVVISRFQAILYQNSKTLSRCQKIKRCCKMATRKKRARNSNMTSGILTTDPDRLDSVDVYQRANLPNDFISCISYDLETVKDSEKESHMFQMGSGSNYTLSVAHNQEKVRSQLSGISH